MSTAGVIVVNVDGAQTQRRSATLREGSRMYGCELLFGEEAAVKARDAVREVTGGLCPCEAGLRCPLLPDDLTPILDLLLPIHPVVTPAA